MAMTPRPRTTAQRPDVTRRLTPEQMKQGTILPKHLTDNPLAFAQAMRRPAKSDAVSLTPDYAPGQGMMDAETMNSMLMHQAPQDAPAAMYAPGAPMPAVPGINPPQGPRQIDYPVGYNIAQLPRSTERTSFEQLRALADLYNGIRMCERVWYDVLNRLELSVTMAPNIIPDGESDSDAKWQKIIRPAYEFLSFPDGERSYHDWLIASTEDVLEIGQSAIYLNTNRKGDIISLDVIDAATLKPLLTQRGTMPRPPYPAYEQFIKGVPAGLYLGNTPLRPLTLSNIEMIREGTRTNSIYSRSRVEDIQLIINLALRKQNLDMSRYTDGSVPAGLVIAKGDSAYTPDEIDELERLVNGQLGGNDRQKQRLKFLPPGLVESIQITEQKDPEMTLDRFVLNVTVGAFGLTMDEISMTENSNRSVGDSQENVIYRRVVKTLTNRYAEFFTRIIRRQFHPQLVVKWVGLDESEDLKAKADVLNIGVNAGAISRSYMARQMGWPVESEIPAFILAPGGASGIVVLDDIQKYRDANLKGVETKQESSEAGLKIAQIQGEQLANQLKQSQDQPKDDDTPPPDDGSQGSGDDTPPPDDGGDDNGGGSSSGSDAAPSGDEDAQAEAEIDQLIAEAKAKQGQRAQVAALAQELALLRARVAPIKRFNHIHASNGKFGAGENGGTLSIADVVEHNGAETYFHGTDAQAAHMIWQHAQTTGHIELNGRTLGDHAAAASGQEVASAGWGKGVVYAVQAHNRDNVYGGLTGNAYQGATFVLGWDGHSNVDPLHEGGGEYVVPQHGYGVIAVVTLQKASGIDQSDKEIVQTPAQWIASYTPPLVTSRSVDPRAVSDEWAAWRTKALRLAKQGKPQAAFVARAIPAVQHAWVADRLTGLLQPEVVRDVFAEARLRDAEAANPTPDHAHQFVAQRCMVCGCGEPENDHGDPTLLTIDTTDGVAACPQCGELSQGKTVSNLWMPGMTCPTCAYVFLAPSDAVVDELRMLRADVLRALEY